MFNKGSLCKLETCCIDNNYTDSPRQTDFLYCKGIFDIWSGSVCVFLNVHVFSGL